MMVNTNKIVYDGKRLAELSPAEIEDILEAIQEFTEGKRYHDAVDRVLSFVETECPELLNEYSNWIAVETADGHFINWYTLHQLLDSTLEKAV